MLLALASGVALALAFEPVALPVLVPFAVAGFVLSTRGLSGPKGFVPGLVFGIGFYFVLIWWMRAVGTDAWIGLSSVEALFYGLLGSVAALLGRLRRWPLSIAAAWVAMEAIRSTWPFSGMPWGRLSFAVVDTPVADGLAYVGSTGVSLLLALAATLLAWLVVARGRQRAVAAVSLAAVVGMAVAPTLAPYTSTPEAHVTVAAVQGDVPGPLGNDILYDFRQVTQNHVQATIDLADDVRAGTVPKPDFVVWPENSTAVDPFADDQTLAGIRAASAAIGVPILVGAIVDAGERFVLNQGIVWNPGTGAADRYTKWHPVPYGEYIPFRRFFDGKNLGRLAIIPRDMLSGTRTAPLDIAGVPVADAICFDVGYDDGLYAQVARGAQLVTVQTSNATFIQTDQIDQQFAMSRLRAIETGRYVVVAATNGVSGIIAPDGSVLDRAGIRTQDVLVERVGLDSSITPAVRLGPWTGRACVGLTLVGLLLVLVPYRRRHHRQVTARAPRARGRSAPATPDD
ncbi:apolipoprotein N-acyltransferase [Nocardioides sp. KIGAM211]|uniref:Apolipoprotein N-acyltransferase n=2 Tax=Nocardioides luti TaxID=2761101 RepID=A0A7X0RCI7_9ACTN|nr:apolipoprotein N-acyltransferase [Nocardioides luti]MBB6625818.1 apolipoprotein N-acyltransferase [Nocardioides luti]